MKCFCTSTVLAALVLMRVQAAGNVGERQLGLNRSLDIVSTTLSIDGVILSDPGSYARPPVTSGAACCQPLAYPTPTNTLRVVAGLRYEMSIISRAATLGTEPSVVRLRLTHNITFNDSDCAGHLDVTNFAGTYSAFDGEAVPSEATAEKNTWQEARIPYSGLYGVCYTANVSQQPQPEWHALLGIGFLAFGAAEADPRFWCAAEINRTCTIRVSLPEATSRLTLLIPSGRCGFSLGEPDEQPFSQRMALPSVLTSEFADQSFGTYALTPAREGTFRICLCHDYEFDVATDGTGACRSSAAQDFPQALGFLYLITVSTSPSLVYPMLRFTLYLHCGDRAQGGCQPDETLRIRLIDMGPQGDWGEPIEGDLCRDADQSMSYDGPPNCEDGSAFLCNLLPTSFSASQPAWSDLTVRELMYNRLARTQQLGVCFCNGDGTCALPENWFRAGVLTVNAILVLPDPFIVGVKTNVQLFGPGGNWLTTSAVSGSHALKLLYDPNGTHTAKSCFNASHTLGTLMNHHCTSELDCRRPSATSKDGPMWQDVVVRRAGYYAVCYCDMYCSNQERWSFVKWHLTAGPDEMYAGVPTQGAIVYAGSRFELTVRGYGMSETDRLAFFADGSLCDSPNAIPVEGLTTESSSVPELLRAAIPGQVGAFKATDDGAHMALVVAHGLAAGDMISFSNVTVKSTSDACQSVYHAALDRHISHCVEALTSFSVRVTEILSESEALLDIQMSAEECEALDFSGASWYMTSRETFTGLLALRGSQGRYVVCWGKDAAASSQYTASAGTLEVLEPTTFLSALHLTSITPGIVAPTILAFELGNSPIYRTAAGPMSLVFGFRNSSRLRHSFRAVDAAVPKHVKREEATQGVCGRLFREIWADSEDGFPQPKGCFYNEDTDEYGMVFSARAGLSPGTRYQVVMWTQLSGSLVSEHEWIVLHGQVPMPPFSPEEIRYTRPDTFGDVGEVPNELSCKEACARSLRCNVAVYHVNTDRHCLLADFSRRPDPYATYTSVASSNPDRLDLTMFMVDRLNQTNLEMRYTGQTQSNPDIVVDLWSMDDMLVRPFGVVESSEAAASGTAGLAPTAIDPRWHLYDGLKVVGEDDQTDGSTDSWTPLQLKPESPKLRLRLRAAPGAPIEAGSAIRLFFWPLTQWALPQDCLVECAPHDPLLLCPRPQCSAERIVTTPWRASRNMLRILLPDNMAPITDDVMHTLMIEGRYLALPTGGFLPSKLAAEVSPKHSIGAFQPSVDYTESTGRLPYVTVSVVGSVLSMDGNARPFAGDVGNTLYSRLQLGSALYAGSGGNAKLALHLPVGYSCKVAEVAPTDLYTFVALGISPQGRGELDGEWSYSGNMCIYHLSEHAAVYGGSTVMIQLTVDNPVEPMAAADIANTWSVSLTGLGDASSPLVLEPYVLNGILGNSHFPRNAPVLGRLTHASLVPSDFWWGAANNMLRIFFRTSQSSGAELGVIKLESPPGFGFYEHCQVDDLPALHYAGVQGIYSAETLPIQPLGGRRVCRAESSQDGVGDRPNVATILMDIPFTGDTGYGFAIHVMHPRFYEPSQQKRFTLTTCAGDTSRPLDRSPSVPLLQATSSDDSPSYGIYVTRGTKQSLQVHISDMMPYAYTQTSAQVSLRFEVAMSVDSADELLRARSRFVSWRVFAPLGYAWKFSINNFFYRQEQIEGITANLPIRRVPIAPVAPPLNRLDFLGENEAPVGWLGQRKYGFDTFINVPPEVPRDSVNEWIVEFGYDRKTLPERMSALIAEAEQVLALHDFNVISLITKLQGQNSELMFQFGTVTTIPQQTGALVIEAPTGFAFEASCTPFAPEINYSPYLPLSARLDCRASIGAASEGVARPTIKVRPLDTDIPSGMWSFVLACVNPSSIATSAGNANTFILRSYIEEAKQIIADVSAVAEGFIVMQQIPFAEIVHNTGGYAISGRDDHPGKASNLVLAFNLRARPSLDGNHLLEVIAPKGFEFRHRCEVAIGGDVFGLGQPYPESYMPFNAGVRIVSCTGYYHFAKIVVSPGLVEGQRYAFRLRVDQQPQVTPDLNQWRLSFGSEGSIALDGYSIWAFSKMKLVMSDTSRFKEDAPVENTVDITFVAANLINVKGYVLLTGPVHYKIPLACSIEVFQLAEDGETPSVRIPNTACLGEQPPQNYAYLYFESELAAIVPGVMYRLSIRVQNPSMIPRLVGHWQLESFSNEILDGDRPGLLDIGRIPSLPITEFLLLFAVRTLEVSSLKALRLPLEFDVVLPHIISAGDMIIIVGPEGYNFAIPVADDLLENDLRTCLSFVDRPGSESLAELPIPLCAGSKIRFAFRSAHDAAARFRFRAVSDWPRIMLSTRRSKFAVQHVLGGQTSPYATAVAPLVPIIPRLTKFELMRVGVRADAVSSVGIMQLAFQPSQPAQAISITTRIALLDFTMGVSFANVSAEVNVAGQVLKEVLVVRNGDSNLVLALQLQPNLRYTFILRGVVNPTMAGIVLWSVKTFARPIPPGVLASLGLAKGAAVQDLAIIEPERLPHLYFPGQVLLWIHDDNLRDEMIDWAAPPTLGRVILSLDSTFLESSFFDFPDTMVSFTISVTPKAVPPRHRLLIFAPADWQFTPFSFVGKEKFPPHVDLGPMLCLDTTRNMQRLVYIVHLLAAIRASAPCRFNPSQICRNVVTFSFRSATPTTPKDMPRWRRESNQAWLLQIDAVNSTTCGSTGKALSPESVRFTNDELFPGFELKESLGHMMVVPEPNGQMSRQKTSVAVVFETRTLLKLPHGISSDRGLYLRLEAVVGLDFDRGCLAAVPDPDYSSCKGDGKLAILRIRENTFATGEHRMVLRATNPSQTPSSNLWMLESFVGMTFEEAHVGLFRNVRQRGRAPGYIIWQHLVATLTPAISQHSSTTKVFLWLRPSGFVEPLGYLEVHAPQDFEMSCFPQLVWIHMPPGRCRTYTSTSGSQLFDLHHVMDIQLFKDQFLLPNNEYELAFNAKNPARVEVGFILHWGVRLCNAMRETLEANMEVGYYNLTDLDFDVVSLVPSATERYAKNEVRILMTFGRTLTLTNISEVRILAPIGWDLEALCTRYKDITGGEQQYHLQLPYSEERGHHACPQANVMLLLLDQAKVIKAGTYTLLVGARNPGMAPRRNFWTVGLLSPGANLGWTPAMQDSEVTPGGLKPGQRVISQNVVLGFAVGSRLRLTSEPSPLKGMYFEVLSEERVNYATSVHYLPRLLVGLLVQVQVFLFVE